MIDIVRLMYDDPEKYGSKNPAMGDGVLGVFKHRGKTWAAYRVTDPDWHGHGWSTSRRDLAKNSSYNLTWFLEDPQGFCHHWWDRYARPGWDREGRGEHRALNLDQDNWITLRFEEIP